MKRTIKLTIEIEGPEPALDDEVPDGQTIVESLKADFDEVVPTYEVTVTLDTEYDE